MSTQTKIKEIEDDFLDPDEPQPQPAPTGALAKREQTAPVPQSLAELAAMKGEALEVVQARIQVLETLRRAAIKTTNPEDWLLFRDKREGRVVGYLQDCGCERVRDLYGIRIFDVQEPIKKESSDGTYVYIIRGSGYCALTRKAVPDIEGGRSSQDDFVEHLEGLQKELYVRKAARANLDGNITRELAGLNSVPQEELEQAWKGTSKKIEHCRKGKGFGSSVERDGADLEVMDGINQSDLPICPKCQAPTKYVPAGVSKKGKRYQAFLACEERECNWTMNFAKWKKDFLEKKEKKEQEQKPPEEAQSPNKDEAPPLPMEEPPF